MPLPVNLENLREMTGGDTDLERELFAVYIESADKALADMRASIASEDKQKWKASAHAWKGTSLNLGADTLAGLCNAACSNPDMPEHEKTQLLIAVQEAYDSVKIYLKEVQNPSSC